MKRVILLVFTIFICISGCDGINPPSADGPAILSFKFQAIENSALSEDVTADIIDSNITAELPFGTDTSSLIPSFVISEGASSIPVSGSINNFSRTTFYLVTSADGESSTNYNVKLTIAENF